MISIHVEEFGIGHPRSLSATVAEMLTTIESGSQAELTGEMDQVMEHDTDGHVLQERMVLDERTEMHLRRLGEKQGRWMEIDRFGGRLGSHCFSSMTNVAVVALDRRLRRHRLGGGVFTAAAGVLVRLYRCLSEGWRRHRKAGAYRPRADYGQDQQECYDLAAANHRASYHRS